MSTSLPPPTAASAKEKHTPAGGGAAAAAVAASVVGVGLGLLRRLQARSASLTRQLSETRSELDSKSSQLSEVMEQLASTRCVEILQPRRRLRARHAWLDFCLRCWVHSCN